MQPDNHEISFIRHGESTGNNKNLIIGQKDYPLTARGRDQAFHVAKKLFELNNDITIYTSDLIRAYQTAEIIAEVSGVKIYVEPGLRERSWGVFEGLTYEQAKVRFPELINSWEKSPFRTDIPGSENHFDWLRRVVKTHRKLLFANKEKNIYCITHLGWIKLWLWYSGLKDKSEMKIEHCQVVGFY